ncbi:DUF2905 domain-containing protein [bacterium]|nr:DUF2905 domain-containing protein [bacterium]
MILVFIGIILTLGIKIPFLGRLPGDILVKKSNFKFYFPITTCFLLSVILTIILRIFMRK